MELNEEEKALVLAFRGQKEQEDRRERTAKIGVLKHDLYDIHKFLEWMESYPEDFLSSTDVKKLATRIKNSRPELLAGTQFVCLLSKDNEEEWNDDVGYGIECMDAAWAEANLKDIEEIKR